MKDSVEATLRSLQAKLELEALSEAKTLAF